MKRVCLILLSLLLAFGTVSVSAADEASFAFCTIEGNVYENAFLGFGCKLGDGFSFYSAEQLASMNGFTTPPTPQEARAHLDSDGSYTEMFASSGDSLRSINIQFQNIQETYYESPEEFDLNETLESSVKQLYTVLEGAGYSDLVVEHTQEPLAGEVLDCLVISGSYYGYVINQKEFCKHVGAYLAMITFSSFGEDQNAEMMEWFYKLGAAEGNAITSPADEYDYAMFLDPAWTFEFDEDGDLVCTNPEDDFSEIDMMVLDLEEEGTLADAQMLLDQIIASFTGGDAADGRSITVGGKYEGVEQYTEYNGIPVRVVCWCKGNFCYCLYSMCSADSKDAVDGVFDKLLASFMSYADYEAYNSGLILYSPADVADFAARISDKENWVVEYAELTDSCTVDYMLDSLQMSRVGLASVIPDPEDEDQPHSLDEMVEMLEKEFSDADAEEMQAVFTEPEKVTIGGKYEGVEITAAFEFMGFKIHLRITIWQIGDRLYYSAMMAQDSTVEIAQAAYLEVLNSFETASDYLARGGIVPSREEQKPQETPTGTTYNPEPQPMQTYALNNTVVVDDAGLKITVVELGSGWIGPELKLKIENNSGKKLNVMFESGSTSINGYMIDLSLYETVENGQSADAVARVYDSDLKRCGIETIADIEMAFYASDADSWGSYYTSPMIRLETEAADGYNYTYDDSGLVLFESDGVKLVYQGLVEDSWSGTQMLMYAENNSDQPITIYFKSTKINDLDVETYFSLTLRPGKHAVKTVSKYGDNADKITEYKNASISVRLYNSDTYNTIRELGPIDFSF